MSCPTCACPTCHGLGWYKPPSRCPAGQSREAIDGDIAEGTVDIEQAPSDEPLCDCGDCETT